MNIFDDIDSAVVGLKLQLLFRDHEADELRSQLAAKDREIAELKQKRSGSAVCTHCEVWICGINDPLRYEKGRKHQLECEKTPAFRLRTELFAVTERLKEAEVLLSRAAWHNKGPLYVEIANLLALPPKVEEAHSSRGCRDCCHESTQNCKLVNGHWLCEECRGVVIQRLLGAPSK